MGPLTPNQRGKIMANAVLINNKPHDVLTTEVLDAIYEGDKRNPLFKKFLTEGYHAKLFNEVFEEVLGK